MSLNSVPTMISKVGIKRESDKGTEATGDYRGIRVFDFPAPTTAGDFGRAKTISGSKVTRTQNLSGESVELTFSFYASKSDADEATIIDIINMILDADSHAGSGDITHTFQPQVIAKPSWTIYHDDGKGNHRVFIGFVANTCAITIDKSAGNITVEVSGFAFKEADTSAKTVDFTEGLGLWSPRDVKLLIGTDILENFATATINFNNAVAVKNTINNTAYPSDIEGDAAEVSVDLAGFWNEGANQLSDTIRTAFLNHTIQSNFIVQIGPSMVNNGLKLTIPKFAIESHEAKALAPDAELPQNLTIFDVNQGSSANDFKVEIFNTIDTDWDTL